MGRGVVERALILAAGVGRRLRPITERLPKALVEVAGQTLLERQLATSFALGVRRVVVVTGWLEGAIVARLGACSADGEVVTVRNPRYQTHGNAVSVLCARAELEGRAFLLVDGDLLLDAAIPRALAESGWSSALSVDPCAELDDEAMKVRIERGRILAIGKAIEAGDAESIGLAKIGAADSAGLFAALEALVERDGVADAYYEDAFARMIEAGWRLGAVDVGGARWAEIDDPLDLARAQALASSLDGA
jgi:choline kinase